MPDNDEEKTDWLHNVAMIIDDMEDEEYMYKNIFNKEHQTETEYFGRGNAKKGYRNKYKLYDSSPVFYMLRDRERVWNAFSLFTPTQFLDLCAECLPLWSIPRTGDEPQGRKHGIESCLFITLGILKTGMSDLEMEAVAQMSHGLISMEFERVLTILDKVLESEMELLAPWEKAQCTGAASSDPNLLYYLDGCDFPVRVGVNKFLYKTHKHNVKHQRAIRAQILIDS